MFFSAINPFTATSNVGDLKLSIPLPACLQRDRLIAAYVRQSLFLSSDLDRLKRQSIKEAVLVELLPIEPNGTVGQDCMLLVAKQRGASTFCPAHEIPEAEKLRKIFLEKTFVKIIPYNLLSHFVFFMQKYNLPLINVICLENAIEKRFGSGLVSASFANLAAIREESIKTVDKTAYIEQVFKVYEELSISYSNTAYWPSLFIESAKIAQIVPCTFSGKTYHLSGHQIMWLDIMSNSNELSEKDRLDAVMGLHVDLPKPAAAWFNSCLAKLRDESPCAFMYTSKFDYILPNFPPFFFKMFSESSLSTLNQDLNKLVQEEQLNTIDLEVRDEVILGFTLLLRSHIPQGYQLAAFGSTVTQLGFSGSDIDLCLCNLDGTASGSMDEKAVLRQIAASLRRFTTGQNPYINSVRVDAVIEHAKVPIIKMTAKVNQGKKNERQIQCDLSIANPLGVFNSQLLATYKNCDDRVVPIVLAVKRWAKQRKLHDASLGRLSSYCYTLMVISYLQNVKVLPYLQDNLHGMKELQTRMVQACNCAFHSDLEELRQNGYLPSHNADSPAKLLLGFFHYYAYEFNFKEHKVTLRSLGPVPRPKTNAHNIFYVEDPFDLTHNTARSTAGENARYIEEELRSAYEVLCNDPTLQALFDNQDLL